MIKEINSEELKKLLKEDTLRDGSGNTVILNDEYRQQIYSKKLSPTLFFGSSEKARDRLRAYQKYPGKIIKTEKSKETGETITLTINADIKDETRGGSFCIRLNRIIVRMGKNPGTWFPAKEMNEAEELFNNWVNFGESYPLPLEQRDKAKAIAADSTTKQVINMLHTIGGINGTAQISHDLIFTGAARTIEWEKGEQIYNNLVEKLSSKYSAKKVWQDPEYRQMKKRWINSPDGSMSFMPISHEFNLGNGAVLKLSLHIDGTGGSSEKPTTPTADIVANIIFLKANN